MQCNKTDFLSDVNVFLKFQKIWHLSRFLLFPDFIQKYV